MSIKSAPYYWLECDGCGVKSTEGGDYTAWSDVEGATDDANYSEWQMEDGRHLCPDCAATTGEAGQ